VAAVEQGGIELLEALHHLLGAGLDVGFLGRVGDNGEQAGLDGDARGNGRLEHRHGHLEGRLVNVDEGDVAALDEQAAGRLDAHLAAAAGNHDHLALEALDGQRPREVGRRGRPLHARPRRLVEVERRDARARHAQALGRVGSLHRASLLLLSSSSSCKRCGQCVGGPRAILLFLRAHDPILSSPDPSFPSR
jgi:hypothetical protein